MNVTSETVYEDGSGWTALVNVKGIAFVASHVNNKVNVQMAPYKFAPRIAKWMPAYVQKWANERVAALPADYHQKHKEIYA
jgi:hypothetical protein